MPLFDYDSPDIGRYNPGLNFQGSLFDKFLLGISGYKADGSGQNVLGKVNNVLRPVLGTAVGAIAGSFIGKPVEGAKLGQKLSGFRNLIESDISRNILGGTNQEYFAQEGLEKQLGINKTIEQITEGVLGGASSLGKLFNTDKDTINKASLSSPGVSPAVASAVGQSSMSDNGFLSNILGFAKSFLAEGGILEQSFVNNQGSSKLDYSFIKNEGLYNPLFDLDPIEEKIETREAKVLGEGKKGILDLIAQGENPYDKNLNAPYVYQKKNKVGPGHFGKYQFTPDFVNKFYGGTVGEFLNDPEGQERAMEVRLNSLNSEARSIMQQPGAKNLDFDKARLLVHFQGYPRAKEIVRSHRFNEATENNPSVSDYLNRAYGKMLLFGGGQIPKYGYTGDDKKIGRKYEIEGQTLSYDFEAPAYALYPYGDKREDLFVMDKMVAKDMGLYDLLDKHSVAEMRYGERVFDQDFSILLKQLFIDPTRSEEDKKRLMGAAVMKELYTHGDMSNYTEDANGKRYFAPGGLTEPKKKDEKKVLEVLNSTPDEDTYAFQKFYNENVATQNGLAQIKEDGIIGTETTRAINNAKALGIDLTANVRTFLDTVTGDPVVRLDGLVSNLFNAKNIQGDDFSVNTPTAFRSLFKDFKNSGYPPIKRDALGALDIPTFGVSGGIESPTLSQTGSVSYADLIKKTPDIETGASGVTVKGKAPAGSTTGRINAENIGASLEDLVGVGTGLLLSKTGLTDYDETDEYARLRSELNDNLGNGFGADVISNFNQNRQNSLSSALNTLQNIGGTQGQSLAAISNIFGEAQKGDVNLALTDEQLEDRRLAQFSTFALNDQSRADRLTDVQRRQDQSLRDAGATLIGDTLQNREDRRLYEEFYGPNSTQNELAKVQKEAVSRTEKQIAALNKSLLEMLKK